MRALLVGLSLLMSTLCAPALEPLDRLPLKQQERIARAGIALAFAHGCATVIAAPTLVTDGLRLLEEAYGGAGLPDAMAQAQDAYWRIIGTIEDEQFGVDRPFDAAACRVVLREITKAVGPAPSRSR